MDIYFGRHGNTFESGEKAVWVGRRENVALTDEGRRQAARVADYFNMHNVIPSAVIYGSLIRLHDYAEIIVSKLFGSQEIEIDERLNELDYGQWSGLTSEEITTRFGAAELEAWNQYGTWPSTGVWGSSEDSIFSDLRDFLGGVTAGDKGTRVLVIASNGILRCLKKIMTGDTNESKMGTGRLGKVYYQDATFKVEYWNIDPAAG